jgi:hypothetical protein
MRGGTRNGYEERFVRAYTRPLRRSGFSREFGGGFGTGRNRACPKGYTFG